MVALAERSRALCRRLELPSQALIDFTRSVSVTVVPILFSGQEIEASQCVVHRRLDQSVDIGSLPAVRFKGVRSNYTEACCV